MLSDRTKTALYPNRQGGRIFYARIHATQAWHICDRALTFAGEEVMALHGRTIKPAEIAWQLAELEKAGGVVCELCLREFERALPVLLARGLVKG